MFHHFHGKKHEKSQGSISAKQFIKIIRFLKKKYNLIDADVFLEKIANKEINKNDTCLTFDDSLKCQIDIALPILKKEKIQAFFFLYTSAFTSKKNMFEIFRYFRMHSYKSIEFFYNDFFSVLKKNYKKKFEYFKKNYSEKYLKQYPFYTENDKKFRFCRDKILSKDIYESIMFKIMKKKNFNYKKIIKKILMSKKDLIRLKKFNQVIGLHSHEHSTNIDKMSYEKQLADYKKNISFLKKNLDFKLSSMSHPFGRYNDQTIKVLKQIGLKIGFLSNFKKGKISSNFEIPRYDHIYILKKVNENNNFYK